ncbi:unnamed protein product [Mytilus coruscus]|uniref:Reverse transcriptase domain-containing protein n=1 Tax=Mytilus coruscus TaxID=42192 RepID=A0A6J8EWN1_MYTCO|nr:unnamed protein product [Mytilus coruscus]
MEDKEVIRKADEPTDWVNSLVVVEKPKTGKLRICLDPRNLNKAIKREHFALPTIEDITTRLTGAKYLSKLDCNNGYWQLRMDKESQLLTTFNSPFGRYCFFECLLELNRLKKSFKTSVWLFENLKGVETDIDDILVWGNNAKRNTMIDFAQFLTDVKRLDFVKCRKMQVSSQRGGVHRTHSKRQME